MNQIITISREVGSGGRELGCRLSELLHFAYYDQLKRQIRAVDKRRAGYYNFLTGQTWGDKENYDLCINTANRSIKKMAPGLARMLSSAWDK